MKTIKQIIREEIDSSFDWVNDLLDNPMTLTQYVNGGLLKSGQKYLMTGAWKAGGLMIHLPNEGIEVEYTSITDNSIIRFEVLKTFKLRLNDSIINYGDESIYLTYGSDSDTLFLTPLENNVNESSDFDWINDIEPSKWDDDWKPEDLVGKSYKSIPYPAITGYIVDYNGKFNVKLREKGFPTSTVTRTMDQLKSLVNDNIIIFVG